MPIFSVLFFIFQEVYFWLQHLCRRVRYFRMAIFDWRDKMVRISCFYNADMENGSRDMYYLGNRKCPCRWRDSDPFHRTLLLGHVVNDAIQHSSCASAYAFRESIFPDQNPIASNRQPAAEHADQPSDHYAFYSFRCIDETHSHTHKNRNLYS